MSIANPPLIVDVPSQAVVRADPPSVKEVRSNFEDAVHEKSIAKGVGIFVASTAVYVACYWMMLRLPGWPLKVLMATITGCCIPMLFVVGHDACHQALTPVSWLNKLIGRIAFLPSLHSYSHWDWGHNALHHGWTNVRGKDPVFVPLTKAEYDAMSPAGKQLHRFYRSPVGLAFYYLIKMWGVYGAAPLFGERSKQRYTMQAVDWSSCLVFAIAQFPIVWFLGRPGTLGLSSHLVAEIVLLAICIGLPFAIWNVIMALIIFQHHTHPEVAWFKDVNEWTFFEGQVASVVHVELPRPIEAFLHNILDHTAHHVDPKIPLYHLPQAQKNLESAYPFDIKVVPWTYAGFKETFRVCRLYDYENHRWIDYDGTPTSPCHKLGRAVAD